MRNKPDSKVSCKYELNCCATTFSRILEIKRMFDVGLFITVLLNFHFRFVINFSAAMNVVPGAKQRMCVIGK